MVTQNRMNATVGTTGQSFVAQSGAPAIFQNPSMLITTGTITSAQIKDLVANPITIISAPGANLAISIIGLAIKFNYGGTNVFVAGSAQIIKSYYLNRSGTKGTLGNLISNAILVGTSTKYCYGVINDSSFVTSSTVANQPIVITNSTATDITGNAANDNTITYSCWYNIVSI